MSIKKTIIRALLNPIVDNLADFATSTVFNLTGRVLRHDAVTAGLGKAQDIYRQQKHNPESITNRTGKVLKSIALACKNTVSEQMCDENSTTRIFVSKLRAWCTQTTEASKSPSP